MPSASCLCGAFRTTVEGSFGEVRYCHCRQCRRGNGSAFSTNARIDRSQWTIEGPREAITEFEFRPGRYKAFCARCGSPLYARSDADPSDVRVRLGGFEGELDVTITGHVWTDSKAGWHRIEGDLPCHPEAISR
ncbi:MAG: GFA family protein [Myxococcales bacterium]|nr:GFA family protein [Myxococcales bacterium]